MNNYTAPNIKEQILFVTNSIVNKMDNVDKIKSSRKTADYPQNKFIVKISQLKKKHKSASVYFLGDAVVKHIAPTTWQPNGYTWTHHPKSVTNIYFNEDKNGERKVLRTHTSPVQIRTMEKLKPPLRVIVPGRTYRSDHDATHSPMFHQCEGLVIGDNLNMSHLKGCLIDFCRIFFGVDDLPVRFRPSYFPFTEPSAEVDIGCSRKSGELIIGEGDEWLEILGSGMVNPRVLQNCGLDPNEHQGFAFGMGLERIAMLKYGIPDLRPFFDSDLRWMKHYGFFPFEQTSIHQG